MALYFLLEEGDLEGVKIGYTEQTSEKRISDLQTGNRRKFIPILYCPGTRTDDSRLRRSLRPYRIRGDWYIYDKLKLLINYYRDTRLWNEPDNLR